MPLAKLQSAMEYLMTYGWAILIIAIVLGALFGLGFFNAANLAPKVSTGGCQVYRPQGAGTTLFINLEGTCNNELPQYVGRFNGAGSTISIPNSGSLSLNGNTITISGWIDAFGFGTTPTDNFAFSSWNGISGDWIFDMGAGNNPSTTAGHPYVEVANSAGAHSSLQPTYVLNANQWYFLTFTLNQNVMTLYVNGAPISTASSFSGTMLPYSSGTCQYAIGSKECGVGGDSWNGLIANLQVYNASFSANEVTALYQEGIGGVPIVLNNLVGWWPLNGNGNDYSGNLNNGASAGVVYTSSWTSGYTTP